MRAVDYVELLKKEGEMDPRKHDGCYELVEEVVRALGRVDRSRLGYEDMDLLFFSTVITSSDGFESKERRIRNSHIRREDKDALVKLLWDLRERAGRGEFENSVLEGKAIIGMFGTGFKSFGKFNMEKKDVQRFVAMCVAVQREDDEEGALRVAEEALKESMKGVGIAAVSQVLHCIKPFVFPILNGGKKWGIGAYNILGLELDHPTDTTRYVKNTRKIRDFRNANFSFKNYRVIDTITWRRTPYSHLSSSGLHFPTSLVTAYLLALKAKPFVILTGISGTGKTALAQEMAKYFSEGDEDRYAFVPVRPDWTDNQGLLGFYNLITQRYEPTELLKLILRAKDDPENPYFLILDEMNLAKVEHYFSDFLSCLESGEPVLLHDQPQDLTFSDGEREYLIPGRLELPPNLFVTGTVNVDETTYMFSPKVLDRAFTLEFDRVDAPAYLGSGSPAEEGDSFRLSPGFSLLPREKATREHALGLSGEERELLSSLEDLLCSYRLHFGYRVLNEISLFLHHARSLVGDDPAKERTAFDFCLLSKVLPKLHGNRGELEEPLARLLFFCFGVNEPEEPADHFADFQSGKKQGDPPLYLPGGSTPRFPLAAAKVHRMWSVLRDRGFVSFVE